MPLLYTESLSMVRKLGANSWLTALKRVFRYPSKDKDKDNNSGRKSRQCKQDEEEEKVKEKGECACECM